MQSSVASGASAQLRHCIFPAGMPSNLMRSLKALLLACTLGSGALHASRSGLNNIPTADTTPAGTYVTQAYTRFGSDIDADFLMGFKTGLDLFGQRFELGFDSRLAPEAGPFLLQAKYGVSLGEGLPSLGLGISTLGLDHSGRERGGEPTSYLVLSQDVSGWFRAHLGYEFQKHDNTVLIGLDKSLKLWERKLVLRSDLIQIRDEDDWMASFGFLYALHENVVLESWMSQPFDDGDPIFTLKLNFVLKF